MEWNVLSSSLISYLTKPKHFVDLESLFQCDFIFFLFFAAIMITEKKMQRSVVIEYSLL